MGGLDETSNGTHSFTITSLDFVNDLPDEVHATTATARETTSHEPSEIKQICLFSIRSRARDQRAIMFTPARPRRSTSWQIVLSSFNSTFQSGHLSKRYPAAPLQHRYTEVSRTAD
jgi:hypothetical protein